MPQDQTETTIQLRNLRKSFGITEVIKGIDLEIRPGEFMVFVGPSGCGKSTLLRMIAGLEDITSGELLFNGTTMNNVVPSKRGIAMVFQSYALYPHMNVFDNMAFGMKLAKTSKEEVQARVNRVAEMLQIEPLLDRLPKQLSGGQRQRVAIGRALVRDPRVFLFDEPLSNLDASLRVATRLEIAKLHHDLEAATMIYVTHDQVEAMTLADRICVLRDGKVEQVGTSNELYERPANQFVASFIGSPKMNFLEGDFAAAFDCACLGIRPEHIEMVETGDSNAVWSGKVVHAEDLGSDNYVFVDIGAREPLVVRQAGKRVLPAGFEVSLNPIRAHLHRFGADQQPIY